MTLTQPEFATNDPAGQPHQTVAQAINGWFGANVEGTREAPALSIATAYFNLGGFELIAESLESAGPVRLLLGSEPAEYATRATITPLSVRDHVRDPRLKAALEEHSRALLEDRDTLTFDQATGQVSERLISWLRRGNVEVRRLENDFLHGKAFITHQFGKSVIAGSANLTRAGLSLNKELNLGVYTPGAVGRVESWFDSLWDQAKPYDLADLYEKRRVPHNPWHVFLRMLWERYGADLQTDENLSNELKLADFQKDGVWRAKRILARRKGVIVADEVGLGKTYIAGELIREAVIERRQKVLIISPATLRDATWRPFLQKQNLVADIVSYEELVNEVELGVGYSKIQDPDQYAMVVIDEAHNLRNPGTSRAAALRHVLSGPIPKDLVFLSATPVNNSLWDLYNLIIYINASDTAFSDVGIQSLRQYFKDALARDPDELTGRDLFDVIDAVAVRRTRRFISSQYPNAQIDGKPLIFPEAHVHPVHYSLAKAIPGFFNKLATALGSDIDPDLVADGDIAPREPGSSLTMARYVPSRYSLTSGRDSNNGTGDAKHYQVQNAGLLQSALLKRFESSWIAFEKTVRTMIRSHEHFLSALEQGHVLDSSALREWIATDSDSVSDMLKEADDDTLANVEDARTYDVPALRDAVQSDITLLESLAQAVAPLDGNQDPKIDELVEQLARISAEARLSGIGQQDQRNKRKVLIFTYFADTAEYIEHALQDRIAKDDRLSDYRDRLVLVTGGNNGSKNAAIQGFTPASVMRGVWNDEQCEAADQYDIAVATDVLAEGVNLQQAGQIINYDLPWNPMRLVQRHGRVDRIGSPHSHIHLRCFFPDEDLEDLLNLEERLQSKLKQAAAAFGGDQVLPGVRSRAVGSVDRVMSETRDQIQRLRAGEATLFDNDNPLGASSEEFQKRLAVALKSSVTEKAVRELPFGAGTAIVKVGPPGIVFCVKIADSEMPWFRYLRLATEDALSDDTDTSPRFVPARIGEELDIDNAILQSLVTADPGGPGIEPNLPQTLHDAVLELWPQVQQVVHEEWMYLTDPRNVEPAVPKIMRDAAALVTRHGGFLGDKQDELISKLSQDIDRGRQTLIRRAMQWQDATAADVVRALEDAVDQLHLSTPVTEVLRPEIELEDIRLVCWTAVHDGDSRDA